MQNAKRDWGEIVFGAVILMLGAVFLWRARLDLLYHIPSYFKGPSYVYPWQGFIGGGLCSLFGIFAIMHGFCRKKKPTGDT